MEYNLQSLSAVVTFNTLLITDMIICMIICSVSYKTTKKDLEWYVQDENHAFQTTHFVF